MLPHEFPKWPTVYYDYNTWRQAAGREATPSAAILDSQRVKTRQKGGHAASMGRRSSRAANGMGWSIPWA